MSLNRDLSQGRIPLKPLNFNDRNLATTNELMVRYDDNGTCGIYLTHHTDPSKYINLVTGSIATADYSDEDMPTVASSDDLGEPSVASMDSGSLPVSDLSSNTASMESPTSSEEYITVSLNDSAVDNVREIVYSCDVYTEDNVPLDEVLNNIENKEIEDRSIETVKLKNTSDSFITDDSDTVATSKAVYEAYNNIRSSINSDTIYSLDEGDETCIVINTAKSVINGSIIDTVLHTAKNYDAPVIINGVAYTVLFADSTKPVVGYRPCQNVRFYIKDKNAIILSGIAKGLSRNTYLHVSVGDEHEISFKNLVYSTGDIINVYKNGTRLFLNVDYTINKVRQTISLFKSTSRFDNIVFESLGY